MASKWLLFRSSRYLKAILSSSNVISKTQTVRVACISTSKKNKDTISVTEELIGDGKAKAEEKAENMTKPKNWISWGWSVSCEVEDNTQMHLGFFLSVTVCLVLGSYLVCYFPDFNLQHWVQREAYLELRRREAEGLPLIDPDLIPLDKIELPSDEELGDTEVII